MPYLACIPAIVALLIAASHLLEQFPHWRPKWTIPFISEQHDLLELPLDRPAQSLGWTTSLLIFSAIGLTADLIQLVPPAVNWFDVIIVFSWVRYSYNPALLLSGGNQ